MHGFPRLIAVALGFLIPAAIQGADRLAPLKTRNVVLVTTDGLRWQEVFSGAEAGLIHKTHGGVENTNALRKALRFGKQLRCR